MRKFWVGLLGLSLTLTTASTAVAQAQSAPAPTVLSMRATAATVVDGERIGVTGNLKSESASTAGRRVILMARDDRTGSAFNAIAGATTDDVGLYRFELRTSKHLIYYVDFAGAADLLAARSGTGTVRVKAKVPVAVTPAQPTIVLAGEVRRLSGRVSAASKGDRVLIQISTRGQWRTVATSLIVGMSLDPRSGGYFRWSYRFSKLGPTTFRVVYPATSQQDSNASRSLTFNVQRWHLLVDLEPLRTTGNVAVSRTNASFGGTPLPNSLKLARRGSSGSVSYDLRGGCSAFAGKPIVYRGEPRDHPVRFLVKVDGVAEFDATARMDQQFPGIVAGDVSKKRTLELVVAGPGTGNIDLWFGAQILCSW